MGGNRIDELGAAIIMAISMTGPAYRWESFSIWQNNVDQIPEVMLGNRTEVEAWLLENQN